MAVTCTLSNHFKYQIGMGAINLDTDTIKILLMATGYTFDKDNHAVYSDVSASELGTGSGYTANTKTLATTTLTENDGDDRLDFTCADVTWTASGGSIGPTPGAILYSDTSSDNTIIGYIGFGSDQTAVDGADFTIKNIVLRIT